MSAEQLLSNFETYVLLREEFSVYSHSERFDRYDTEYQRLRKEILAKLEATQ